MAAEKMTVHELRERAESIAMALEEAQDAVERAREQAGRLHRQLEERMSELPRFCFEVTAFLGGMARDLGAPMLDHPEERGDFDVDRLSQDARDLLDLIDLGTTRKERVHHGDDR